VLWLLQLDGGAPGLPSPLLLSPASAVRGGFPLRVTTSTTATATSRTTPMPNAETGRMVNRGLAARLPPPSSTRGAGHGDNGAGASATSSAAPPALGEGAGGDNALSALPTPQRWQWQVGSTSRASDERRVVTVNREIRSRYATSVQI
jgi:hypothetical protein